jgi:regulatory protein
MNGRRSPLAAGYKIRLTAADAFFILPNDPRMGRHYETHIVAKRISIDKATVRGKRYLVTVSSGETVRIDREVVFKYGIFKGSEFGVSEWESILRESAEQTCFSSILSMVNRRMHTELEIRRKLYKKFIDSETIQLGMERAEELGLLDDEQFARVYVGEKYELNGWGRRRIESELYKRGVSRVFVENAFDEYIGDGGEELEYQNLKQAAEKKLKQLRKREEDPHKLKRKLLSHLASRGFSASMCYQAMDELL